MQPIHEREQLKSYYQDEDRAASYVDQRFVNARGRLLHRRQLEILNATIAALPERRVLELAVGPARVTRDVRGVERGVGIDASPQMLELARRELDAEVWELHEADIFQLELGQRFPLIYSFRFVRHLKAEQRAIVYARVRDHLEDGGLFLLDACNAKVEGPLRAAAPHKFPVFDQLYERAELVAELHGAGFRIEQLHGILRWHRAQRILDRVGRNFLPGLFGGLVELLEQLPGSEPLEWAVLCRRA